MDLAGKSIALMGKSGAGKGTQLELLKQQLSHHQIMTIGAGDLFRALIKTETLAARKMREVLNAGGLAPSWLASFLWQREIVEKLQDEGALIFFDGSPRKLPEAHLLDEVLTWLGREPLTPVYIDVHTDEVVRRLKTRGRRDDTHEAIHTRLGWFETDVRPIVHYYSGHKRLVTVDGNGTIDEVFQRLTDALSNAE